MRLTQYLLGLGVISCLATIATWIAFGPGPRAFTVSLPFVGRGAGSETVGRAVFGTGAVLMWVFFAVFVVVSAQRLRAQIEGRLPHHGAGVLRGAILARRWSRFVSHGSSRVAPGRPHAAERR